MYNVNIEKMKYAIILKHQCLIENMVIFEKLTNNISIFIFFNTEKNEIFWIKGVMGYDTLHNLLFIVSHIYNKYT